MSRADPEIEILGEGTTRKLETSGRGLGKKLGVGFGRAASNSQVAGQQFGKSWTRGGGVQGNAIGRVVRGGANSGRGVHTAEGGVLRGPGVQRVGRGQG